MIDTNITIIFWDTIAGLIKNLPYFILIVWGVRKISKEMPNWISQLSREKKEKSAISQALGRFGR